VNVGMDWIALQHHPLWRSLWDTEQVTAKIKGLENALLTSKETDPQVLGRQRGELAALRWLVTLVDVNAEQQGKTEEKPVAAVGGIRRWMPRIR
jgi:hypothetical protein